MQNYPRVTVVTVVKNAQTLIEKTIKSVLEQDYPNLEYVILDGNSEDYTKLVIQTYKHCLDVYISEPDNGIYDAMNKAANMASGEWIIYMNAGDCFYACNSLTQLLPALNSNADVIFTSFVALVVDEFETRTFIRKPFPLDNLWHQIPTSHQAIIVRLSTQKMYGFNTHYKWCADHDMIARMYKDGKTFIYDDTLLSIMNLTNNGSHHDPRLYIRERWQISKGLVSYHRRLLHYSYEWVNYLIWCKLLAPIKKILPASVIVYLRRVRGTAGDQINIGI